MSDKINQNEIDLNAIPRVCQERYLSLYNNNKLEDETSDWLKVHGNLPLWSRLKSYNCLGQPRAGENSKKDNYAIELPGRLLSLFGTAEHQANCRNKMDEMKGYQLLSTVLALCAILKENFLEWSENLLNDITSAACSQYPDLLQELAISDKELKIHHLNRQFTFKEYDFKIQLHQSAKGFVYIRYGLKEFNLARVLPWFFQQYQFGILQCSNRTLAFGRTLDSDYPFFMYDCQSYGQPLFEDQQANNYILRTNHLQILLYCLTMTLNVTKEMIPFTIFNADVVMTHPLEKMCLKREEYIPVLRQIVPNPVIKDFSPPPAITKPVNKTIAVRKKCDEKIVKAKSIKTPIASKKKITLDPDKMYYIIEIPKKKSSTISAKLESMQLLFPKTQNSQSFESPAKRSSLPKDPVRPHNLQKHENYDDTNIQNSLSETNSNKILTGDTAQANILKKPENLGFKVFLVDESGGSELNKSNGKNQIKIAHQLRDFFIK